MLPRIIGTIDRRILLNYRASPALVSSLLPRPFEPRSVNGHALIGVCMIRFKGLRPAVLPSLLGLSSENAAHRISVAWTEDGETRTGVYVTRRDTNSALVRLAGGRIFAGVHGAASFDVEEADGSVDVSIRDSEGALVSLSGRTSSAFSSEVFASHDEASRYFQDDRIGYSPALRGGELEGLELDCHSWETSSLAVEESYVREFAKCSPEIVFDHALIMRGISHGWSELPRLCCS